MVRGRPIAGEVSRVPPSTAASHTERAGAVGGLHSGAAMAPSAGEWLTTTMLLQGLSDSANNAAWSRFIERFRAPLLANLRRSGARVQVAEDLAQETLLEFARAFREGRYDWQRGRLRCAAISRRSC